ncbi:hypothetical protein OPKNFCMD_5758 [Methylobacterium crusticola]|uniref:Peptidoglycan binding-like domain-containing protein n=1 Tax=Methylobacterium crusticola TaxID=1697972 RepID=A0ABQ4R744_9HYPH|nr:serine protease [Methylobacterium crusticola]GJD52989.1 hypothetical protein OPKNFCMD_5758 [Methylobacterium crusticola]
MRLAALAIATILAISLASAQVRSLDFTAAETVFNALDFRTRVITQVLLIASGYQNSVPTESFGLRTFGALKRFQEEKGLWPNGILTGVTSDRLFDVASPLLNEWDFRLIAHPGRDRQIWIPQGLGLRPHPNKRGLTFQDDAERLKVSYSYFRETDLEAAYASILDRKRREGFAVHYSVIKDGWFVVSATSPNGRDEYLRYHQDGDGILGFSLFWENARGNVNGERVAILMSASLGSVMNGRPMVDPPGRSQTTPQVALAPALKAQEPVRNDNPPIQATPPMSVTPAPVPPVTPKAEEKGISTGTGFFVDGAGNLVTNAHVIKDCKVVVVKLNDNKPPHKARVVATDNANDLALLSVENGTGYKFASLRTGTRLGEGVAVFGYPHTDILASSGNFTIGNVTALAGIGDDSRYYQISAPVQQGNSGGPLLDNYGNVIGVVAAKLNVIKMAAASGDFAQNINFAIKSSALVSFLDSNQIGIKTGTSSGIKLDPPDLADTAKGMSGLVACQ